jgi:hypothetical protein
VRVPKKTTKYKKEPTHGKHIVGFAPELIKFIKERKKVLTYRFGNKYDYLKSGDLITIEDSVNEKVIGKAKVTSKEYTTFYKLPLNIPGHEIYKDKKHQKQVFSGYYAYLGRNIKDNDKFLILGFQLKT